MKNQLNLYITYKTMSIIDALFCILHKNIWNYGQRSAYHDNDIIAKFNHSIEILFVCMFKTTINYSVWRDSSTLNL